MPVDLPHTWNRFDVVDNVPGYRRAVGWYKRILFIPVVRNELRYILDFEGVNMKCDVYVNGARAGGHVGGYVGFAVDLTPFLEKGKSNTILVKVDNSYDPSVIPSQKSDFCIYGGITRDVWLKVVPTRSLTRLAIKTPSVSRKIAETVLELLIVNSTLSDVTAEVEAVLKDRTGKEVARKTIKMRLVSGLNPCSIPMPRVKNPSLWSPADPALYTASVMLKYQGKPIDQMTESYGYRWFEFKEHGPFYLNGERLLLRGTHRHEDYAGYGNAMPDSLHRKDIRMIKEMGANFVRLAHYPQDPEVYRACDELGILVWDELPWCRGGMGGEEWKANTRRLLREQITQNSNHPSIIIYSLGNELYWLPDFPGGDNLDSLRAMVKELNAIVHQLDPGRLTATRKFTEGADLVDLVSPSIWPGWYGGTYKGFEPAITEAKDKFARFFHAEYGGDSHAGRHSENPVSGDATTSSTGWEEQIKPQLLKSVALSSDWCENYMVNLFDWSLHISERLEWFTGNAQWAFKDFPTPLRPENPIPYVNQKGLVDRAGNPKDAYYVFKSYWTTSPLFCYIESHTWLERNGPTGLKRDVKVFSNCPEVELFVNGVSQGRRTRDVRDYPACGLSWRVDFTEGENRLRAIGFKKGQEVTADSMVLSYRYKKNDVADRIELSSELIAGGNLLITALAVDKYGRRCLDYNKRVYFTWGGAGELLADYGTPTRSSVIEMANGKAQIEFKPVPGFRSVVEARTQDFKGSFLIIGE
ncbi:MAG TPA: beta-galactosidase [Bacteroidetes bacterium]|nr:beta-galactosidase [Bacteroidota bacterium]